MKTRQLVTALTVSLVCVSLGQAQEGGAGSAARLAVITARGRLLAAYDTAAWYATDAVQAMHPAQGSFHRYIGKQTINGWLVSFGRLNDTGDKFLVAYEAAQSEDPQHFTVKAYDPPQEETDFYFHAAKAIEAALHDFQGPNRHYNVAVLPADAGQLYVYVYPAQTEKNIFVAGADARFLVTSDGSRIIEKHQMHKSLLEFKDLGEGKTPVAGMHTHVLTDLPEDSDIFYVLSRKPHIPEDIITKNRTMYEVRTDGTVVAKKF